jgi:hypothetical protein
VPGIHVFASVRCPYKKAAALIQAYLREQSPSGASTATVELSLHVGDLKLEHDVLVTIKPRPGYPGYEILDIHWEARGGGPFPTFTGKLSLEDEGPFCRLNLDGEYKPPLGIAGAAFDAVVGHRIAEATGNDFLEQLRQFVEEREQD